MEEKINKKLEIKKKSKDRVKLSFDCTIENYNNLNSLSEKTGHNRNELLNMLIEYAMKNVEVI